MGVVLPLFPFLLSIIIKDSRAMCDALNENSNWEISKKSHFRGSIYNIYGK